jgi:hypothetical protein
MNESSFIQSTVTSHSSCKLRRSGVGCSKYQQLSAAQDGNRTGFRNGASFYCLLYVLGLCICACFSRPVVLCWYFGPFAFVICVWVCHFLPPVFSGFKCLCMCVPRFVALRFVIWSFLWFVCGCFVIWSVQVFSFVYNFCVFFWSWDTRRWIKSTNTIRLILIHHRQNPT